MTLFPRHWRTPRAIMAFLTRPAVHRLLALGALTGTGAVILHLSGATPAAAWQAVRAQSGETTLRLAADAGLRLAQITVEGRQYTAGEDIVAALGIAQGEPLLAIDPQEARRRLQSLGWVKEATVERRLPDLLHVRLTERTPLAMWQIRGEYKLVDADGVVISDRVDQFRHLPLVVGPGASSAATDLFTMLAAEPDIAGRVVAATRIGERRWDLRLDSLEHEGVTIRLPEYDAAQALGTLARLNREQRLLERAVAVIDLRLPDRMVVQLTQDPAATDEAPKAPGGRDGGKTAKPGAKGAGGSTVPLPLGRGQDA